VPSIAWGQTFGTGAPRSPVRPCRITMTSANDIHSVADPPHTRKVDPARQGAVGSRFASPHTVRSNLDHPLQCSARFGIVFRCASSEYHHLTAHFIKCRQIPSAQVGHSHNPLVAGSSPARPTSERFLAAAGSESTLIRRLWRGPRGAQPRRGRGPYSCSDPESSIPWNARDDRHRSVPTAPRHQSGSQPSYGTRVW
jgi:hypothetical protein